MSRSPDERFSDILAAIERCLEYRTYLDTEEGPLAAMAIDAVLRNVAVIGEAVRALPETELVILADVPWRSIAGLRTVIVHEYFRIQPALITEILDDELVPLAAALRNRLLRQQAALLSARFRELDVSRRAAARRRGA